jgi:hypothetical protein
VSKNHKSIIFVIAAVQIALTPNYVLAQVVHSRWAKMASQGQPAIAYQGDDVGDNCSALDIPETQVISQPARGKAFVAQAKVIPHSPVTNRHHHCNNTIVDGVYVYYRSEPNFVGSDTLTVMSKGIDGRTFVVDVTMKVMRRGGF